MKKIFLDTNVFLRFFIPTDTEKHQSSKELFSYMEKGRLKGYTSNVVFLECFYVLTSFYKIPRDRIFEIFTHIAGMRNMTIIEQTHIRRAIALWHQTGVKFTDCLIATQVGKGIVLCTYDQEFAKIPSVRAMTPAQVLQETTKS